MPLFPFSVKESICLSRSSSRSLGGGAGDEVVQEGRGQVSQGFEYCDINCGYPLRNSEPFNGIIRCVFYKDHSGGMVLDRVGRQVPRS